MRSIALLSVILLNLSSTQPERVAPPPLASPRVDHILLWGRSIDEVTSFLAPTQQDLGLFVEFHSTAAKTTAGSCGDSSR